MSRSLSSLRMLGCSLVWLLTACSEQGPDQGVDGLDTADARASGTDAAHDAAQETPEASGPTDAGSGVDAAREAGGASEPRDAAGDATLDANLRDAGGSAEAGAGDAAREAAAGDPENVASALNALFIDVPCAASTPTPLAEGATCLHPGSTQHIEKMVTLAGAPGTVYAIKLRVRGIWEPTKIQGGERPDKDHPFNVGGMLPAGTGSSDAISYQQYSIQVSEPKQTYWLNDHQYLAHDIHKEDYVASLRVAGAARVTVIMNDGNDHQIANWTKSYFADLPPYDKTPSTGQSLRLDVLSVERAP